MGRCRHDSCFPDTTCALGHLDRTDCEYWLPENEIPEPQPKLDKNDFPWNSYALGMRDLAILGGRGRPIVVGLIGPPNSGKTSLLAFLYMWLFKYGELPNWVFCGSWTLGGWESIVHYCRWTGEPPPSFPPHTSSTGRTPGLLHLCLRNKHGVARDVLFTDAPGEWFTQWAKNPNDESAVGASWVIRHSDVFLLLADCGALADFATLPQARQVTRNLTERVGALTAHVPLAFTWTKIDRELKPSIKDRLETARLQFAPYSEVWETTINKPETIAGIFSRAIELGECQRSHSVQYEPRVSNEPFLAFRGHYVDG